MDVDEAQALRRVRAEAQLLRPRCRHRLADAVQRLRFEHPEVKVVVLRSGKDRVFCAGANIRMLAGSSHAHKVNFCKFTNQTRNSMEDASRSSGQKYMCAVRGTAAGGGYELALATDHILLADDGNSTVALPELPLLAVLPGTGGLTRVTDKRKVRRDLADAFCTVEEGVKGSSRSEVAPRRRDRAEFQVRPGGERCGQKARCAVRPRRRNQGHRAGADRAHLRGQRRHLFERQGRHRPRHPARDVTIQGPSAPPPPSADAMLAQGASFWPLRLAHELDDAILHLRLNESEIGVLIFKAQGDSALACLRRLPRRQQGPLARPRGAALLEAGSKRVDLTSRSLVALVEPGSCFAGTLAEFVFACDRSFMLIGSFQGDNRPPATLTLSQLNFGTYPMSNDLSRLATRFLGEPASVERPKPDR